MHRVYYLVVAGFWAVMMFLLVQSEFGELHTAGTPVPAEMVWRKIIQASDPSLLAVTLGTYSNRIGSFKCLPSVVEPALTNNLPEVELPEGMSQSIAGYTLDFDGNCFLYLGGTTNHLRLSTHLKTDTNLVWQELQLHVGARPDLWLVEASAAAQTVTVQSDHAGVAEVHRFTFNQLAHPERFLGLFGNALLPELAAVVSGGTGGGSGAAMLIELDARKDHRLKLGSQRLRCFRLRATLLSGWTINLYVNPQSGEIIRIDLPNHVSLINETFM